MTLYMNNTFYIMIVGKHVVLVKNMTLKRAVGIRILIDAFIGYTETALQLDSMSYRKLRLFVQIFISS
jgi:hypothetical protein